MKKVFLALLLAAGGSLSQAAVTPVDLNHDGSSTAFLDAAHGLLWTTGKQIAPTSFSAAVAAVGSMTNEGRVWRLPTVAEFENLYETQGHISSGIKTGQMIYGGVFDFNQIYYWTSDQTANPSYYHQSFAVNYPEGSSDRTREYAYFTTLGVIGVSPVPEPEICAMLLAGLGLIGAVVRRRKQRNLVA